MPHFAVALRQEITRLARREIRSQTQGFRKASAQFRKDIADLERHTAALKAEADRLERRIGKEAPPAMDKTKSATIRFSAKSVVAQRRSLGISAADFGKLIGVTAHTVYKWEHGTTRPRQAQLIAFANIRSLGKMAALANLQQMREKAPKRRAPKR